MTCSHGRPLWTCAEGNVIARPVPVPSVDERHLLCLSILGHRTAPDGTLPADAVADLAELLWGGR